MKRRRLLSVGFTAAVLGMLVIQCGDDGSPCDPDPCLERNGLEGTCGGFEDNWWCECIEGAQWNNAYKVCEGGVDDPCLLDRCWYRAHAVADTCVDEGGGEFSCDCNEGFEWNVFTNTCGEPCADEDGDGYVSDTCTGVGDCDDSNPYVYPGARENCYNGIDDDCDTLVDCLDPDCGNVWPCTSAALASTPYGSENTKGTGLINHLAFLLIPFGAVIFLRILRRKK